MNPGAPALPAAADSPTALAKLADYVELTKPRIVVMELVAIAATLHLATGYGAPGSAWSASVLLSVALGTCLVAGSANALNQWIERERDAKMPRTRNRPLPAGRLTPNEALWFGVTTLAMGESLLAMGAGSAPPVSWLPLPGLTAALVALATWVVYVAVYTPLKSRTWLNTAVGALSGATPLWIGWAASGRSLLDPMALAIVAVMYVWQFPHFMAIAWLCRDDYDLGGYKMSTNLDPSGRWAGVQAVVGSAILLPVSLAPLFVSERIAAAPYGVMVGAAGLAMLTASASFLARRDDKTARRLMRISLIYIPVWLAALWCCGA